MEAIGPHQNVTMYGNKDVNGRFVVSCDDCQTCAYAYDISDAKNNLAASPCISNCENCNNLRHSYDEKPAVPMGGTCNTKLHICPNDGRKWWQSNRHFHLWQQVTDPKEWETLFRSYGYYVLPDD